MGHGKHVSNSCYSTSLEVDILGRIGKRLINGHSEQTNVEGAQTPGRCVCK